MSKGRILSGMRPTGRLHLGELAQSYLAFITPIRERREHFAKETSLLEEILTKGAEKARAEAEKTMEMVRKAVRL